MIKEACLYSLDAASKKRKRWHDAELLVGDDILQLVVKDNEVCTTKRIADLKAYKSAKADTEATAFFTINDRIHIQVEAYEESYLKNNLTNQEDIQLKNKTKIKKTFKRPPRLATALALRDLQESHPLLSSLPPFMLISTANRSPEVQSDSSYSNAWEAAMIVRLGHRLLSAHVSTDSLQIVTCYRAQKNRLNDIFTIGPRPPPIRLVSLQDQERPVSCGILIFAMTRTRHLTEELQDAFLYALASSSPSHIILTGPLPLMRNSSPFWSRLISFASCSVADLDDLELLLHSSHRSS